MNHPVAFLNGKYLTSSQLMLPVDDLGVLQGVAVSERMRTFRGTLFRCEQHLDRLYNSLRIIDVTLEYTAQQIGQIAEELVEQNHALLPEGDDLGLSLFVTPGMTGLEQPTLGIQCYPLPFEQWASYYTMGQALTETGVRQVPASCWPVALKCRSRMHYYLADKLAHKIDPDSRAVLLDQDGFVAEASTANVVIFREDVGIVSPPLHRILPGVSLTVLGELASSLQIPLLYEPIQLDDLAAADEILLCSTSPCVWPVTRVNRQRAGRGVTGHVFSHLLSTWGDMVGLDIAAQAHRFANRR